MLRCGRGHVYAHPREGGLCTACGARTHETRVRGHATLILVTTVRVNPFGAPFRLGLAVTRSGRVRVLCRVVGPVRGSGNDRVVLEEEDGVFVARPPRGRLKGRSRA